MQTDPASLGQDLITLCGPYEQPCVPSRSPFMASTVGFAPSTVVVYRIERVSTDNQVHVLAQGRVTVGSGFVLDYTYAPN